MPCGSGCVESNSLPGEDSNGFIWTDMYNNLLVDLLQSLSVHDVCLISPRGTGKSALIKQISQILGQRLEPLILYQVRCLCEKTP